MPKQTDHEFQILTVVCNEPIHGYGVYQYLKKTNYNITLPSVYDVLHRLHANGYIHSKTKESGLEHTKKAIYQITDEGKRRLQVLASKRAAA